MKNAAPRPGHGPQDGATAAVAAVFAAARQRPAGAAGRAGVAPPVVAIPARRVAVVIRVVPAVSGGPAAASPADRVAAVSPVAGPAVAADPAAVDAHSASAGRDARADFAGA